MQTSKWCLCVKKNGEEEKKVCISLFQALKLNIEFNLYFCKLASMELEQENVVRASTGCGGWVDMAASTALRVISLPGH